MMIQLLFMLGAALTQAADAQVALPPACRYPVYCNSSLLHYVQTARIFNDSKTFVDYELRNDENDTLTAFQQLLDQTNNNPSREQLTGFVQQYFVNGSELDTWTPTDYNDNPSFLNNITDAQLREFARNVHVIWPTLGRIVRSDVFENPGRYSFIPVSHGFIIPGGRFRELYYWDAYWIVEGLLISGMQNTVKGMIENLIELLKTVGHVPNGSRWYYQERSQPPLLTAMVALYVRFSRDYQFLQDNIDALEQELNYWLDTQTVTFEKDDGTYTLLRYYVPSAGPRPESYAEDYGNSRSFVTEQEQNDFYIDIKSAAESGWDFSTRWFIDDNGNNTGNLTQIHTRDIIPVDLNSIFAGALQNVANFHAILGNVRRAAEWGARARQWRSNIDQVLWNDETGVWLDYDTVNQKPRNYFYPSNFAPLWMNVVKEGKLSEYTPKILQYLENSGALDFRGGIPTSLSRSGEQWDLPNSWPPLVSMIVNAMETLGTDESKDIAFEVAQNWVRANYRGYQNTSIMFEKYDAENVGEFGGGGEYTVQAGFGWSNGVVLEFLARYGDRLTVADSLDDSVNETA